MNTANNNFTIRKTTSSILLTALLLASSVALYGGAACSSLVKKQMVDEAQCAKCKKGLAADYLECRGENICFTCLDALFHDKKAAEEMMQKEDETQCATCKTRLFSPNEEYAYAHLECCEQKICFTCLGLTSHNEEERNFEKIWEEAGTKIMHETNKKCPHCKELFYVSLCWFTINSNLKWLLATPETPRCKAAKQAFNARKAAASNSKPTNR